MKKYKYLNIELIMVMFLTIINSIIINIVNINNSFAAPSAQQLLNQQLILQQQQEQRRQQEQNQLQIDDAENIRKTRIGSDGIESIDGNNADRFGMGEDGGDGSSSDGSGSSNLNCIKFNKIEIVGNKIYSTRYLNRKVLNKYIDKCINKKNIDNISNSLMKIYIDKGYSTTRVYFDISKLKSENIFIFVIDEGRVNDIVLNNVYPEKKEKEKKENKDKEKYKEEEKSNKKEKKVKEDKTSFLNKYKSFRLKSQTFFAFPLLKGKTFNLKDFEQGLDQLNRLQSNNATLDIKPVLEIENGKLKIENEPSAENNNKPEVELVPLKVRNKINLNYTLTFDSQYSWDTLYGTDQFSIGGEYTVRGFREATISGDNGYYIRNDLRINLQQLFPRILLNTKIMNYGRIIKGKNIALSINDFLSKIYLSIFYDYGYVKDKYSDSSDIQYNSQSGHMSGTGIALNYYGRYLNWSLTYAKALHSPNYLQSRDGIEKEGHSLYWRVGGRF